MVRLGKRGNLLIRVAWPLCFVFCFGFICVYGDFYIFTVLVGSTANIDIQLYILITVELLNVIFDFVRINGYGQPVCISFLSFTYFNFLLPPRSPAVRSLFNFNYNHQQQPIRLTLKRRVT